MRASWRSLQIRQPRVRVAEVVQLHTHPVHQREIQAADLAVLVALVPVVQHAAGGQRAAEAAEGEDREPGVAAQGKAPRSRSPEHAERNLVFGSGAIAGIRGSR